MHVIAELIVEIDHYVAAKNNIKLIKRCVRRQIMLGENNVFAQKRLQDYGIIFCSVVFGKSAGSSRLHVVLGVLLHSADLVYPFFGLLQGTRIHIRCINTRFIIEPLLMQQNRHRIYLFTGRAARMPNSDVRIGTQQRDDLLAEG
ncbi:hypothetical protein D3C75_317770 [compost metagenome]